MSVEAKRGCGYRKVHGLYLVGDYVPRECDRLPFPLHICPTCSAGIKVGRGMTRINPQALFGVHGEDCHETKLQPCFMCDPSSADAFIMRVGEKFYPMPEDFLKEGLTQGLSKRISQIPRGFIIGQTVIYLAHINACVTEEVETEKPETEPTEQPKLMNVPKPKRTMGIFSAFIPQRIEKLFWKSEVDKMTDEEKAALEKRKIRVVSIPDNDYDHQGRS